MNQRDAAKNAVAHLPLPSAEAGSRLGSHIQEEELKRLPTLLVVALEVALAAPEGELPPLPLKPRAKSKSSSSPALDCLLSNLPAAEMVVELPPKFLS